MTTPRHADAESFIPVNINELLADLIALSGLNEDERKALRHFAELYIALFHFRFHRHMVALKRCYRPFNPDAETVTRIQYSAQEREQLRDEFLERSQRILIQANYRELKLDELGRALNESSPYGLQVSVQLDDYDELRLYHRGSGEKTVTRRDWRHLFLRSKTIQVPVYRRLMLMVKLKDVPRRAAELTDTDRGRARWEKRLYKARRRLGSHGRGEHILIKLFKDIPRTDLETLLPTTTVRISGFDKLKLGITGGGGTIGGIAATAGKLAATANPVTMTVAVAGLAGVLWRQLAKLLAQRTKYMALLARHLYFHNLDNNLGVLSHLMESAEEEECKESLLAYFLLYLERDQGHDPGSLDRRIEAFLLDTYGVGVDYEIEDGLGKLRRANLLQEGPRVAVVEPRQAFAQMDEEWDAAFDVRQTGPA